MRTRAWCSTQWVSADSSLHSVPIALVMHFNRVMHDISPALHATLPVVLPWMLLPMHHESLVLFHRCQFSSSELIV